MRHRLQLLHPLLSTNSLAARPKGRADKEYLKGATELVVGDESPVGSAKDRFNARFPLLNQDAFRQYTIELLETFYPRNCSCGVRLAGDNIKQVSDRENAIRCLSCNKQHSRTAGTPLHHLKVPMWVFGYLLTEQIILHPQVLSSEQIRRRLGVAKNTALLLKRRLQLFHSDLIPYVKKLMAKELSEAWANVEFPRDKEADLRDISKKMPIPQMDACAIFSASQRANGGRARFKHRGATSSIYLSDVVAEQKGRYQIGTLAHTIALKKGPVILDSVPDLTQRVVHPLMDFLPGNVPVYTDDAYPWLCRYRPHRAVNHSARAKNRKRNVWARNRWSRNGVHNNTAEGIQRSVKHAFTSGYGYFRPEHSRLYLDEFSSLKTLQCRGLGSLVSFLECEAQTTTTSRGGARSFRNSS